MTTNNDNDLALALARAVDAVRDGIGEPVWTPLEALLPIEECGGFMYMGATVDTRTIQQGGGIERRTIFAYKHGITRKYLHIGDDLRTYVYLTTRCTLDDPLYQLMNTEHIIRLVFADVERFGATRETKYNAEYIAERNARLVAAGYAVIG